MAYGEPLQPNKCEFEIGGFDGGEIQIMVHDLEEPDNDDIREVVHPDFDKFWDNSCENIFVTEHFNTMREAIDWCVSIGMEFIGVSDESEIGDIDAIISIDNAIGDVNTAEPFPIRPTPISVLKQCLKEYEQKEQYEKCAELLAEIKKRETEANIYVTQSKD